MGPPLGFFSHASETLGIHGSLGSPIRSRAEQGKTMKCHRKGVLNSRWRRAEEGNAKQRRSSMARQGRGTLTFFLFHRV